MAVAFGGLHASAKQENAAFHTAVPAAKFIVRRVLSGLVTLLVVSILIFIATNVLPGNVAAVVLGHNATPERLHTLEHELHLDRSIVVRYGSWLGGAVHGDFGSSAVALAESDPRSSIGSSLSDPLLDSLLLGGITTALLIPLTLLLGGLAGTFAGRKLDHAISMPSLVVGGLPEFVTATVLVVIFFTRLHLLPPVDALNAGQSPLSNIKGLVLPVITLLGVALASGIRQVRAGMIEVLDRDYVHVARLNGLSGRRLLVRYGLRNALAPSVQSVAQSIQYLVGGIIIVESVFSYPGIGTYLVQAVTARDVTEVQAAALILAALYIAINISADLIVVLLVPKLRTELS
jgi:peptide/nickel transport system permease protein